MSVSLLYGHVVQKPMRQSKQWQDGPSSALRATSPGFFPSLSERADPCMCVWVHTCLCAEKKTINRSTPQTILSLAFLKNIPWLSRAAAIRRSLAATRTGEAAGLGRGKRSLGTYQAKCGPWALGTCVGRFTQHSLNQPETGDNANAHPWETDNSL